MKKIGLASDHAGYELKQFIKKWLDEKNKAYVDYGTNNEKSCDYPDYAHPLANAIEAGVHDIGIAVCGSGNGINMTLNKHQGIRAALCWLPELASLAKQHNNANVLVMPGRFIDSQRAKKILNAYFDAEFEGGRHQNRINKMSL